MIFTTFVDRCEEKSDITRIFLRDGLSFDLPMLVMHKEEKILSKTLKRFCSGTQIRYHLIFGDDPPPDADLTIQGSILHVDDSAIGVAGGLIVRFSNFLGGEKEFTVTDTLFSVAFNFL